MHDAYDFNSKPIKKKSLKLPKGKKPLILSIDDMNYYEYMRGNGLCRSFSIRQI